MKDIDGRGKTASLGRWKRNITMEEGRPPSAGKMEAKQIQTSLVKTRGKIVSRTDTRKTAHFVRWEDHSLCSLGRTDQARGTKRPKDDGRPLRLDEGRCKDRWKMEETPNYFICLQSHLGFD